MNLLVSSSGYMLINLPKSSQGEKIPHVVVFFFKEIS